MSVYLQEQETVISIMRTDDRANIYTSDTFIMRRLEKKVEESDEWELEEIIRDKEGNIVAKVFSCPKKLVVFRTRTIHRELSDEQREQLKERIEKYWVEKRGAQTQPDLHQHSCFTQNSSC